MDLDKAKKAVEWMRAAGVLRLKLRAEGEELEIELAATSGDDSVDTPSPLGENAGRPTNEPGMCIEPGCARRAAGLFPGYCHQHGRAHAVGRAS